MQVELRETKEIAVLIVSRHKRGKKSNKNNTADTEPIIHRITRFSYNISKQIKNKLKDIKI
jgi:hypothetical protein